MTPIPADARVEILVNAGAGAGANAAEIHDRLVDLARDARWTATPTLAEGDAFGDALDRIGESRPDAVIVAGGDGSILGAAQAAISADASLGIIPMGTMNLMAKDLGVPIDVDGAIDVLRTGVVRHVDVGAVNDELFLHSSLIGIVPRIGAERERMRRLRRLIDLPAHALRAARAALTATPIEVVVSDEHKASHVRTYTLAVVNNQLGGDPSAPYRRVCMDGGTLAAYLSRHRGRLGLLRLLLTLGVGLWSYDPDIAAVRARSLEVASKLPFLRVSNDGEIMTLPTPLRYEIRPGALRVIAAA